MIKRKQHRSHLKLTGGMKLKTKIELAILIILLLAIPLGVWSNVFAYEYYYFKCQDKLTEVFGNYYRIPYDNGYGIHPGSDYSNCSYSAPAGKVRYPSTKAAAALAPRASNTTFAYDTYVPEGYAFTKPVSVGSNGGETSFDITTQSHGTFHVRELSKDGGFSYTNVCWPSKNATSWTGTIVSKDGKGRDMCRLSPNQYVQKYVIGINIGRTGIMLEAGATGGSDAEYDAEAAAIFSSMRPYTE